MMKKEKRKIKAERGKTRPTYMPKDSLDSPSGDSILSVNNAPHWRGRESPSKVPVPSSAYPQCSF